MRTRNANTPKTPTSQKKTPKKSTSAVKTPQTPMDSTPESSVTPGPGPTPTPTPPPPPAEPKPQPAVKQAKASSSEDVVTPTSTSNTKGTTTKKVTKRIIKKKVVKPKTPLTTTPTSTITTTTTPTPTKDITPTNNSDSVPVPVPSNTNQIDAQPLTHDQPPSVEKEKQILEVDELPTPLASAPMETTESIAEPTLVTAEEEGENAQQKINNDDDVPKLPCVDSHSQENPENINNEPNIVDSQVSENKDDEKSSQPKGDDRPSSQGIEEEFGEEEGFVEPGDEDLQEDDEPDTGDEYKAMEEENKELAAAAKERKVKKQLEIFVGGLDREVVEEDVKKTFEKVGDVLEVRLLKDSSTNKNRGFAFVRFSTQDQAKRALTEMKNPVIRGKRCGTAPNEDNDTLFLGNVCNTWTKEAIKQKLKEYDVEGVENITLVQDPRHEGLSRGFCFIQFSCHADAMFAYKRLQKPDAIFGHTERTAKVAFAEPLQEPDPEVMAKVKSVFIDGLPPHWDEDRVRKHFKVYGEIERITLARNMSSAKRKDFGFVDFTTHEAAIACIEDVNRKELSDGNSKTKVRARLSNPLPKTQAVKGGMCGGLRIGRPSGRTFSRTGPVPNRLNFQYDRPSRGPFNDPVGPYGRRIPHRGGHGASGALAAGRPNFGGPRDMGRGFGRPVPPRREPFPLDDGCYSRPFMGRQYDDPYVYDDSHGLKRPFYMTDQDPAYMEPSRVRPRFDYSGSGRGIHFRDTYGPGSGFYSSGYYGSEYGARPHPPFNGRDRPYGGGHGYYY